MDDTGRVSRRTLLLGATAAATAIIGGGVAAEWDNPRLVRLRGGCGDMPPVPESTYRVVSGQFTSAAMGRQVPWLAALPPDHRPGDGTPVVLCLTGLGDGLDMVTSGVGLPGFASAGGERVALVAPGGGGTTYWHPRADGTDALRWAVDELLPATERWFRIGGSQDRRGVLGWSMGGYGALLVAQQRPGLVSAVAALSPAVFPSYDAARSGHDYTFDSAADWEHYGVWPHLDDLAGTAVRIDCGDADPFAPTARQLLQRTPGAVGGISPGCHDRAFWRRHAPVALRFLADHLAPIAG